MHLPRRRLRVQPLRLHREREMSFRLWRKRQVEARERADQAVREVEQSKRNLKEAREDIKPLAIAHKRNQFSELIRDALLGNGTPGVGSDSNRGGGSAGTAHAR